MPDEAGGFMPVYLHAHSQVNNFHDLRYPLHAYHAHAVCQKNELMFLHTNNT